MGQAEDFDTPSNRFQHLKEDLGSLPLNPTLQVTLVQFSRPVPEQLKIQHWNIIRRVTDPRIPRGSGARTTFAVWNVFVFGMNFSFFRTRVLRKDPRKSTGISG
jgi:hypothetical protein